MPQPSTTTFYDRIKVGKMGGIYAGITSGPADCSLAVISTARWSAILAGQSGSLILTT